MQNTKKVIGIIGNALVAHTDMFGDVTRAYVNSNYVQAVLQAGGLPMIIPPYGDIDIIETYARVCDGFLFSGGNDLDPSLYNEEPMKNIGAFSPDLDSVQLMMFRVFEKTHKPILGICRGLQIINVAREGSLYQDIPDQIPESIQHVQKGSRNHEFHKVMIDSQSQLAEIMNLPLVSVNSLHHQSVKKLGNDLKITAKASDGVIEAIESSDNKIIGVQWHPEDMIYDSKVMNNLFTWLVDHA